jgi:hypothetical protein
MDRDIINRQNPVAGAKAGIRSGRIWRDMPRNDSGLPFDPRHPIIGRREHGALLEIDDGKDNGCKGCQGKDRCPQPNPKIVIDWNAHLLPLQSPDAIDVVQTFFQII